MIEADILFAQSMGSEAQELASALRANGAEVDLIGPRKIKKSLPDVGYFWVVILEGGQAKLRADGRTIDMTFVKLKRDLCAAAKSGRLSKDMLFVGFGMRKKRLPFWRRRSQVDRLYPNDARLVAA